MRRSPSETPAKPAEVDKLRALVAHLRGPDGCPWDRAQTLPDLRSYLLEEAHETAAAIDAGFGPELRAELGDLLFQVVFVSRLAEEEGAFDLADVVDGIHDKMVARHPHVFGEEAERLADAGAVRQAWEQRKARHENPRGSLLAGVPESLPALVAAYRLTQKAAGVGFDWPAIGDVVAKVHEELAELEGEIDGPAGPSAAREELGDLLFAVVNLARHLGADPEAALAAANRKFRRRFQGVEDALAARGRNLADTTLEEMDALWDEIKDREGGTPTDDRPR